MSSYAFSQKNRKTCPTTNASSIASLLPREDACLHSVSFRRRVVSQTFLRMLLATAPLTLRYHASEPVIVITTSTPRDSLNLYLVQVNIFTESKLRRQFAHGNIRRKSVSWE